jgi:hypothetical protein
MNNPIFKNYEMKLKFMEKLMQYMMINKWLKSTMTLMSSFDGQE